MEKAKEKEMTEYGENLLTFRRMQPDDIPAVAGIERETFSLPWSENAFLDTLSLQDAYFIVALLDGEIAGYCGYYRSFEEAEITNVAVRSDLRGKGIGSSMIRKLADESGRQGIARLILEVRKSNLAAIRVYEKNGFRIAGYRRNFYEQPREDAAVMVMENG